MYSYTNYCKFLPLLDFGIGVQEMKNNMVQLVKEVFWFVPLLSAYVQLIAFDTCFSPIGFDSREQYEGHRRSMQCALAIETISKLRRDGVYYIASVRQSL